MKTFCFNPQILGRCRFCEDYIILAVDIKMKRTEQNGKPNGHALKLNKQQQKLTSAQYYEYFKLLAQTLSF